MPCAHVAIAHWYLSPGSLEATDTWLSGFPCVGHFLRTDACNAWPLVAGFFCLAECFRGPSTLWVDFAHWPFGSRVLRNIASVTKLGPMESESSPWAAPDGVLAGAGWLTGLLCSSPRGPAHPRLAQLSQDVGQPGKNTACYTCFVCVLGSCGHVTEGAHLVYG